MAAPQQDRLPAAPPDGRRRGRMGLDLESGDFNLRVGCGIGGDIAMSDRAPVLLRKAMQSLQPAERDELLDAVLLGQLSSLGARRRPSGVARPVPLISVVDRDRLAALLGSDDSPTTGRGALKVLPVRVPEADYERLKTFCGEHGFSMAVVIRTLLERFLDDHASDERQA